MPFPGHDALVADRVDEVILDAVHAASLHRGPPLVPGDVNDPPAEPLDRGELRHRRVVWGDDRLTGTPSSRAIQATPCAMFPVLVVTRPAGELVATRAEHGIRRRRGS